MGKPFLYTPGGVPSTGEEGHSTDRVTFSPNGPDTPTLLMVQTNALIVSCANLQSDWKNTYFQKGYVDIRSHTRTDLVSLVSMGIWPKST